jgi:uncharacterized membrane protein YphA (DoxX/SURF4 family)
MTAPLSKSMLTALRWTLGLVVLAEGARTFYFAVSAAHAVPMDHLHAFRVVISAAEIIAAVLFLIPAATSLGGWSLLVIFFLALVIHISHGYFPDLEVLVYGVVVIAVMSARKE